ncbi:MAG: hypothetical protein ACOC56_01305 [Atribacterota bacterium]
MELLKVIGGITIVGVILIFIILGISTSESGSDIICSDFDLNKTETTTVDDEKYYVVNTGFDEMKISAQYLIEECGVDEDKLDNN